MFVKQIVLSYISPLIYCNITFTNEADILSPEAPVDGHFLIQQDIWQASFRAVLCDDADVGDLNGTTNELA